MRGADTIQQVFYRGLFLFFLCCGSILLTAAGEKVEF